MLGLAARPLGGIAGKQDRDGVKVRPGEAAQPVVWVVLSGIAEHFRAGDHALLEFFGKGRQRNFVHTQRA